MKIITSKPEKFSPNRAKKNRIFKLIKRDGALCRVCGESNPELLTVDHINPRGLGGKNHLKNLQVLCYRCHWIKDKDTARLVYEKRLREKIPEVPWKCMK